MDPREILTQSLIDEGYLKTPRIIDAFRAIDRTNFVLPEYKDEAYGNYPLPIGYGQTISQPLTVAFMLELLDPQPGEKILDIGAGSGWQTTLLAYLVSKEFPISNLPFPNHGLVFALERIPELCAFAKNNIEKYEFVKNGVIKFYCQDATAEIPDGPYDKIIAAAAVLKDIPEIWREKLKVGGKIVTPIAGSIWLFSKKTETEWEEKEYPGFSFVPLVAREKSKIKNPRPRPGSAKDRQKSKLQFKTKNLFILLAAILLLKFGLLGNEIYFPHVAFSGGKSVEIPTGLGSRKIAELLKKEGVIRSKWALVTYISLTGRASSLKPGSYVFFNSSTIPKIAADLVHGGTNERIITIIEGWSVQDIGDYFEREDILSNKAFPELINVRHAALNSNKFDFLADKPEKAGLEGYLFPDTYRIFVSAGAKDVILKMLENFGRKLNPDLRKEITTQKKTVFEIVTMASIIEKEVVSDQDRALVSGILWKRLDLGIGLQVDATITYLTGKKSSKISKAETEIDSPYNTYKYRGLPQGPIANPGFSAIRAAVYPKDSPYLYYLSAPDGRTIFSRTLEEHNAAKVKYLKFDSNR